MIKKIKKILLRLFDRLFPNKLYGTTSYSQDGEDILLASFYEDKRDYKGTSPLRITLWLVALVGHRCFATEVNYFH